MARGGDFAGPVGIDTPGVLWKPHVHCEAVVVVETAVVAGSESVGDKP